MPCLDLECSRPTGPIRPRIGRGLRRPLAHLLGCRRGALLQHKDMRLPGLADYCESDVVNTYRVWLRHELFRANLTHAGLEASEASLEQFIKARINTKPHLGGLIATQG